jgi:hypothetical protein
MVGTRMACMGFVMDMGTGTGLYMDMRLRMGIHIVLGMTIRMDLDMRPREVRRQEAEAVGIGGGLYLLVGGSSEYVGVDGRSVSVSASWSLLTTGQPARPRQFYEYCARATSA